MPAEADLHHLAQHYDDLVRRHGAAPQASQWSSRETQHARLKVLSEIGDLSRASILDLGCGTGELAGFLCAHGFSGTYLGVDLSTEAVNLARQRFPDTRFRHLDILAEPLNEHFDYVLMSGLFNNKVSDGWALLTEVLHAVWPLASRGLAFNAMSCYVDYQDPELQYYDPCKVFHFCKTELSHSVQLRHDYQIKPGVIPFEFAVYVHRLRSPAMPRR